MKTNKPSIAALAITAMIAFTAPAYAYLDPGTGSAIVTTILGFFAAIAFTFRKYYYKIVSFFRREKKEGENN